MVGVGRKWCWRCRQVVPWFNEAQYSEFLQLARACSRNLLGSGDSGWEPLLARHREITGENSHQNAILHHRLSDLGPDCVACGKPLPTPRARFCAACGLPIPVSMHPVHDRIATDIFIDGLTESDAFLLFGLLHNYLIEFRSDFKLVDRPETRSVSALTQRGASQVLARLPIDWRLEHYTFWNWKWNSDWHGPHRFDNVSDIERSRLGELIGRIESHPFVELLDYDDE